MGETSQQQSRDAQSVPQVTVSPAHRFGQPCMNGISTERIADYYSAGDDVEAIHGLTRHELLVVLWFEAIHGQPRFRRRWRAWADKTAPVLWRASTLDPRSVELPAPFLT